MKKLLLIPTIILFLAGCNTVSGVGRDISAGGHAITSGATSVQQRV